MKYYAVKIGRTPGLYIDHEQAVEQIKCYKGALMKSFKDKNKALEFLTMNNYYVVTKGRVLGIFRDEKYFNEQIKGIQDAEYAIFQDGLMAISYFGEKVKSDKYYVVQNGKETGIFIDEKVYQKHIKGFKGASGKSYKTLGHAILFLTGNEQKQEPVKIIEPPIKTIKEEKDCVAYVDGSYDDKKKAYALGVVLFLNGKQIEMYQTMADPNWIKYGNVAGEVIATTTAMREAIKRGAKSIVIKHDLMGLSQCLKEDTKANAKIWKSYRKTMKKLGKDISYELEHVKAHTGVEYNVLADRLARKAQKENQKKLKVNETNLL